MMKRSNNKYDVFKWVKKVILSCKTIKQDFIAEELIYNFDARYNDSNLTRELLQMSYIHSKDLIPTLNLVEFKDPEEILP